MAELDEVPKVDTVDVEPDASADAPAPEAAWLGRVERGSIAALRFAMWLYRTVGRRPFQAVLYVFSAYFFATGGKSRRASHDFLRRVAAQPGATSQLSRPPSLGDRFRHVHEFSTQVMDRVCVWWGETDRFVFIHKGADALRSLEDAASRGRGAIFLGSHYGSFDMLRSFAGRFDLPVNVVMYTLNAPVISAALDELAPEAAMRVIAVAPGSPSASFEIRACLERGEIVAILADRAGPADATRTVSVDFLGSEARLPRGPFEIALMLRAPVLVATGKRVGDATYEVSVEPFYDGSPVRRPERDATVEMLAQAYASHLERACVEDPYQWFNYFDYWEGGENA